MAILHSILGKLTGKVADSSFYEDRAGQNILRSLPGERRPGTEAQQRWEAEFAALLDAAWLLGEAVYVGFPAGRKYPALEKGFLRANAKRAAEVEPIDPDRPFVRKKGVPRYFKARVDYARVLVADGTLVTPEVEVTEVRAGAEAGEHVGGRSTGQAAERREEGKVAMAEGWEEGQAAERGDEGWMAMAERKGEEWRTEGEGRTAEMREEGLTAMAEGRKEGGEAGMEGRKGKAGREKRERVVRFGHRGTVRAPGDGAGAVGVFPGGQGVRGGGDAGGGLLPGASAGGAGGDVGKGGADGGDAGGDAAVRVCVRRDGGRAWGVAVGVPGVFSGGCGR